MASSRLLIRSGTVLTLDPQLGDLSPGEILVEDGKIAAVGTDLGATDVEMIDLPESIALPGFVDTHRHTWQAVIRNIAADWTLGHYMTGIHNGLSQYFRPQDTYAGNLLGHTRSARLRHHDAARLVAQPGDPGTRRRGR